MQDPQGNTTKEAWTIFLVLGVIMINFPFIHIFNNDLQILGIPSLVLYFFIGWPASILVIRFFIYLMEREEIQVDDERGEN